MKIIKNTFYISLLCLSVVFTACSSDNNDDNNNGDNNDNSGTEEFLRAKIDGANFEASNDPATLIGATTATSNGVTVATAQGSTNSGDFINFSIINYNGPGTYVTGDDITNPNGIQYGKISPLGVWASGLGSAAAGLNPGEIIITKDQDGVLEGTFSFEGYNADNMTTKNITQGSFRANID